MAEREVSAGRRDLKSGSFLELRPKLEAVVFDLDGTLCDSIGVIINCTQLTFEVLGQRVPDASEVMVQIGKKLPDALYNLLPDDKKHLSELALKTYLDLHYTHQEFKIDKLFPKVGELLERLKAQKLKIGVASGRMRVGITHTLEHSCLGDYCEAFCAGDEVPSKPDPSMMYTLCERLGVSPSHCLGVGDSGLDLMMYANSGAFSFGVQTGVWSGEAMLELKPQLLLPKATDLLEYL
ncbi:MAG: HAD-IA family hydrolase [Succinivibrio sp.]|nr:HAD-IA family hydrolase [Succinivibrio sp.]